MPDLSAFHAASRITRMACTMAQLDLTDEQRASLDAALATPEITGVGIARVLKDWGQPVAQATIRRHRLGQCSCGT